MLSGLEGQRKDGDKEGGDGLREGVREVTVGRSGGGGRLDGTPGEKTWLLVEVKGRERDR